MKFPFTPEVEERSMFPQPGEIVKYLKDFIAYGPSNSNPIWCISCDQEMKFDRIHYAVNPKGKWEVIISSATFYLFALKHFGLSEGSLYCILFAREIVDNAVDALYDKLTKQN